jgi:uncharacterized membrane-anchored protein
MRTMLLITLLLAAALSPVAEDKASPKATPKETAKAAAEEKEMTPEEFEASLKFQRGKVTLRDGLAVLTVPAGFRYLDPEQTERLLVDAWGNPPGAETLGMLLPSDTGVVGDAAWGVVITYDEDGYVKDDEAEQINYDELLEAMREGTREGNAERKKLGYEPVELIGWAAPPRYDRAAHKLYWAKELKFGDAAEHTLNYDIRVLGRRGVLSLNAVASTGQLKEVEAGMRDVLKIVEFNEGHRYGDYVPGVDKVAAYGLGALVAGKLAAKAGLFKVLIGALVAGKKFLLIGLVAVGFLLKKLFTRKTGGQAESAEG